MSTDTEDRAEIRRRVLVGGPSGRAACREHDIRRDALTRIPEHPEPPGGRRPAPLGCMAAGLTPLF